MLVSLFGYENSFLITSYICFYFENVPKKKSKAEREYFKLMI